MSKPLHVQAPALPGSTDEEEPFLHCFFPSVSTSPTVVNAVLAMTQHSHATLNLVNRCLPLAQGVCELHAVAEAASWPHATCDWSCAAPASLCCCHELHMPLLSVLREHRAKAGRLRQVCLRQVCGQLEPPAEHVAPGQGCCHQQVPGALALQSGCSTETVSSAFAGSTESTT